MVSRQAAELPSLHCSRKSPTKLESPPTRIAAVTRANHALFERRRRGAAARLAKPDPSRSGWIAPDESDRLPLAAAAGLLRARHADKCRQIRSFAETPRVMNAPDFAASRDPRGYLSSLPAKALLSMDELVAPKAERSLRTFTPDSDVQVRFSPACAINAREVEDPCACSSSRMKPRWRGSSRPRSATPVTPWTAPPTASARISSAQTERYDVVVLDLGLPRVDGLTLLRRWRDAGLVDAGARADRARRLAREGAGHRRRRRRLRREAVPDGRGAGAAARAASGARAATCRPSCGAGASRSIRARRASRSMAPR